MSAAGATADGDAAYEKAVFSFDQKDFKAAKPLLEALLESKSLNRGQRADVFYKLGRLFWDGLGGVNKSREEASELFNEAGNLDHPGAMWYMIQYHKKEEEKKKEEQSHLAGLCTESAVTWCESLISHKGDDDNPDRVAAAAFIAGQYYEQDDNVDRDVKKALSFYKIARTNGHKEATYRIEKLLERRS